MIRVVRGDPTGPTALVLPGTAFSADFVARAFGPALEARGLALATAEWRGGKAAPVAEAEAELEAFVRRRSPVLLGGVSLGAHVVARVAARLGPAAREAGVRGVVLTLPAWTGPPEQVAALSGAAARTVDTIGVQAALAEMRGSALPWVHREVASAWARYREEDLAGLLKATAATAAPSPPELASLPVPAGLLAFGDDPFHPLTVARFWVRTIPTSYLRVTSLQHTGRNIRSIGDLALGALDAAVSLRAASPAGPVRSADLAAASAPRSAPGPPSGPATGP